MAAVRKKQDDNKINKMLREVAQLPGNKHCFDCQEKGVTYVNTTIGSFVCTSCSGILRGLTPPHRVKSISMATFSEAEIEMLRQQGNEECAKTWLGLWDAKRALKMDHRDFMVEKYERKRYYLEPASPLKSIPSTKNGSGSDLSSASSSSESANTVAAAIKSTMPAAPSTVTLRLNKPATQATTNDPHSLFKTCSVNKLKPTSSNGLGVTGSSSSSTSSFASCHSSNTNNNQFSLDAEFPVDFSKADFFSASNNGHQPAVSNSHNKLISNGSSIQMNGNGSAKPLNGINKMVNGFNGNDIASTKVTNGFGSTNGDNGFDNWADFEHNQIYNASEDKNQYLNNNFGTYVNQPYLKSGNISNNNNNTSSSCTSVAFCLPTTYIGNNLSCTASYCQTTCTSTTSTTAPACCMTPTNFTQNPNNFTTTAATMMKKQPIQDLDDIIEQSFNEISNRLNGELKNRFPNGHKFFNSNKNNNSSSNNNNNSNAGYDNGNYSNNGSCVSGNGNNQSFVVDFTNANLSSMFEGNGNASTTTFNNVNGSWASWQTQSQTREIDWSNDRTCIQPSKGISGHNPLDLLNNSNNNSFNISNSSWSLPLSSFSNTTSSSINSTPSADKYAALKDLDEQFKEIKVNTNSSSFSNGTGNANNNISSNNNDPFNTSNTMISGNGQPSSNNPFKNPFNAGLGVTTATVNGSTSPWTVLEQNGTGLVNGNNVKSQTNGWTGVNGFTPQYEYQLLNGNGFGTGPASQTSLFDMNGFGTTMPTNFNGGFQGGFNKPIGTTSNPFAVGGAVPSNNPFL